MRIDGGIFSGNLPGNLHYSEFASVDNRQALVRSYSMWDLFCFFFMIFGGKSGFDLDPDIEGLNGITPLFDTIATKFCKCRVPFIHRYCKFGLVFYFTVMTDAVTVQ